jgi:glycosyltransferase involved in cell wall biosynthesis
LLKILSHLRNKGVSFECRIVGGGPLEHDLRSRLRELSLGQNVQLIGVLPYTETALLQRQWADVLLFTGLVAQDGDRDGLPNVIPEALAAGLPVITSPVAGTTEAITNGETGWVVPLDDYEGWAQAILQCAQSSLLINRLRERSYAWVKENFDASRNAATLSGAIRNALITRE